MTIHVNIGEAKTRLSELVGAARRGEEVVVAKAGEPQVRLVPVITLDANDRERVARRRQAAFGMWRHKFGDTLTDLDVRAIKPSDEDWDNHYRAKFTHLA